MVLQDPAPIAGVGPVVAVFEPEVLSELPAQQLHDTCVAVPMTRSRPEGPKNWPAAPLSMQMSKFTVAPVNWMRKRVSLVLGWVGLDWMMEERLTLCVNTVA